MIRLLSRSQNSLCYLGELCVSVVRYVMPKRLTTETQRAQRKHRVGKLLTVISTAVLLLLCCFHSGFAHSGPLPAHSPVNITVAQDGSGQFKSVQDAIMSVPAGSAANPVVIHIKPGTYKEQIYIQHERRFLRLLGENAASTILTFD